MKTVSNNGALLFLNDKLMQVNGFYKGEKVLCLDYVKEKDKPTCNHCGHTLQGQEVIIAEGCRNFQQGAEAVLTLEEG